MAKCVHMYFNTIWHHKLRCHSALDHQLKKGNEPNYHKPFIFMTISYWCQLGPCAKSKMEVKALKMCMSEILFKKTEPSRRKVRTPKPIPSNNLHKYRNFVEPIWETSKVSKNEVINFVCRNTHEIKPTILMDHENDVLYQIFAEVSGQDVKFMRTWLDMFVRMHEKSFEQCGKDYFKTKGLTFSCWAESILDDRKADVMCIYSLCMLTEVHAWVHLHSSRVWTTLKNDRLDHETSMERCAIHLAYLGQGLYVSLHPHKLEIKFNLAQAADTEMDVKPVIIGELTSNESSILDKLIKFGLGAGID